jgi:hypothetical protein
MKKTLWIAIAGALAASVIAASAQEVHSANAVGYIKRTVPANGGLEVISYALNPMPYSGVTWFTNTSVASEMPNYSWAYFWNDGTQRWVGSQKSGKGAWDGVGMAKVVLPGEMFFLKTPPGAADQDVTITGEVPDDPTLERAVIGSDNNAALGNPYPVDVAFTNLGVAQTAANYSWAYFWNPTTGRWIGTQKSGKGAWDGVGLAKTVLAGEGFFLKDLNPGSVWTNTKPYTWP